MLAALEARLETLRLGVEELRLRAVDEPGISVQMTALPAITCCLHWCKGYTYEQRYADMYAFYGECIRRGVRLSDEPLFTISDRRDFLDGVIRDEPYRFAVCVPVHRDTAPADAETLPPCRALSVLCCGGYGEINEAWLTLGREVRARALTPTAPPRVLGIVAPYTGREIEERRYCSRIVLPVEG